MFFILSNAPSILDAVHRYDLIAIDLDGTLLNSSRDVSGASLRAIQRARDAGVRVAVCTGRGLSECRHVLERIAHDDPVVVAGGSIIACPTSGRTLHRFNLPAELVSTATQRLLSHEHPVMVLKDPAETGYDYLMVVGRQRLELDPVTTWWLRSMNVAHRLVEDIAEDPHPDHTVRLGVCGLSGRLDEMMADARESFGERVIMHHFGAVVAPEHSRRLPDGQRLHILEIFSRDAGKWSAVQWLAQHHGIEPARIAAIGDEVNDLPMIRGAGLGVAMGNAIPAVKDAAKRQTTSNDDDGVAHAIERILDGSW